MSDVIRKCSIDGCENKPRSRGICVKHFNKLKKTGELPPLEPRWDHWTVRLEKNSKRNPKTGCVEWQKSKHPKGYGVIYFDGKLQLAHRAAWLKAYGDWPDPELVIDHICNNPSCVNIDHLRELPNHLNLRRAHSRGTPEQEHQRAVWRKANAKRRGNYRYTEGGEDNTLVQS